MLENWQEKRFVGYLINCYIEILMACYASDWQICQKKYLTKCFMKSLDQASKLELVWHIFTDLTSNFIGSWASVGVKPYQSEIYELNEVCNPPDKDLDRCHHVTVVFFSATWVFNYFCLKFFLTPMISLCPLLKGNKIHL